MTIYLLDGCSADYVIIKKKKSDPLPPHSLALEIISDGTLYSNSILIG
jgi:hypothetical protein